jgi:hypothetical protein
MNTIKQILGVLWIILAVAAAYFCIFEFGLPKLLSDQQDDLVFGIIILFILTPLKFVFLHIQSRFSVSVLSRSTYSH